MVEETSSEPVDDIASPVPDAKSRLGCLAGERFGDMIRLYKHDDSCTCSLDLSKIDVKSAVKVSQVLTALATQA